MNIPLKQFICDSCHQLINEPNEGVLEWISTPDSTSKSFINSDFKIVHQFGSSPKIDNGGCSLNRSKQGLSDTNLESLLKKDSGIAYLLSLIDPGPNHQGTYTKPNVRNVREYVELVRRLTIEHYDEARMVWDDAKSDGFFNDMNEIDVYKVSTLKKMIQTYIGNI